MATADTVVKSPERFFYGKNARAVLEMAHFATDVIFNGSKRQTAWQDLNGIEPEGNSTAELPYYLEPFNEAPEFIDRPEVACLFERYNLPQLNSESLAAMNTYDRRELADRFVAEIDGNMLPNVLMTEGCAYWNYGFSSEDEARRYGRVLGSMRNAIRAQPFYEELKNDVISKGGGVAAARRVAAADRAAKRELCVVFDTQSGKLRTHFEPVERKKRPTNT